MSMRTLTGQNTSAGSVGIGTQAEKPSPKEVGVLINIFVKEIAKSIC